MGELITLDDIEKGLLENDHSSMVVRTPLLRDVGNIFGISDRCVLHLKLENMQKTGT